MNTKQAVLVVFESPNGRDNWVPITASECPEWVKHPDIIGKLVAGQQCMDAAQGDKGSKWYKASRVVSAEEKRAEAKRQRKDSARRASQIVSEATQNAKRLTH